MTGSRGVLRRFKAWGNAGSLMLHQVALMSSPAVALILVARFYDFNDFVAVSYALSLYGIASAGMYAGLTGLAVREFASSTHNGVAQLFSSMVGIRVLAAVVCAGLMVTVPALTGGKSSTVFWATMLMAAGLLFRSFDALDTWYQAREDVHRFVYPRIAAIALLTLLRVWICFSQWSIYFVIMTLALEPLVLAFLSKVMNRFGPPDLRISMVLPQRGTMRALFSMSWYLLISALAAQGLMRVGNVYLEAIGRSTESGMFAASSRITELFFFLPVIVTIASYPRQLRVRSAHGRHSAEYLSEVRRSSLQAFGAGCGIAVGLCIVAPILISIIYGPGFDSAVSVLRITSIVLPFVFLGAVMSKWLLTEELYFESVIRNVCGLVVGVLLMCLLAPRFGAVGTAVGYVVGYVVANFVSVLFSRKARPFIILLFGVKAATVRQDSELDEGRYAPPVAISKGRDS